MAKKSSLKAALNSQQNRLKKNAKVQEAAQKQNLNAVSKAKGKAKAKVSPSHSTVPFRAEDKILLIGEGNFSFTLALFKHPTLQYLPPSNVTATAYDSEAECEEKYPESKVIIEELRSRGVEVLFNVDATALEKCKALKSRKWDRIVWNFPHAGKGITDQDRNILSNQMLILGFLRSAAPFLRDGPIPTVVKRKKKTAGEESASEDEAPRQEVIISEDEDTIPDSTHAQSSDGRAGEKPSETPQRFEQTEPYVHTTKVFRFPSERLDRVRTPDDEGRKSIRNRENRARGRGSHLGILFEIGM